MNKIIKFISFFVMTIFVVLSSLVSYKVYGENETYTTIEKLNEMKQLNNKESDFIIEDTKLVKYIGNDKIVYVPDGITRIGERAFQGNDNIEKIVLSDSVTFAEKMAFASCRNLKEFYVGANLVNMYTCVFTSTPSLEKFVVSDSNENYYVDEDGALRQYYSRYLFYFPSGKKIKSYTIPNGIEEARIYNIYIENLHVGKDVNMLDLDNNKSLKRITVDPNNSYFSSIDGVLFTKDQSTILKYPIGRTDSKYVVPVPSVKVDCKVNGRYLTLGHVFEENEYLKDVYFSGEYVSSGNVDYFIDYDWYSALVAFNGLNVHYPYENKSWQRLIDAYNKNFGISRFGTYINFIPYYTNQVKTLKLDKSSLILNVGNNTTLKPIISPNDATNKKLTWTSSNTSIASIDSNGKITGKKSGSVTITAKTTDGSNLSATCKVTIKEVLATSVKLNKTSLSLDIGKSETLKATISPTDTTNKKLTWSSSNTNIVTVDQNGKITAKNPGTVTITVKTSNNKSATCKVTIKFNQPKLVNIYNSAHGADIRFKPVSGATHYSIYRKENGVWSSIRTVKTSELTIDSGNYKYIDTSIKNNYGKGYIYSVAAKKDTYQTTYDTLGLPLYRLKQPTIKTIKALGNNKVELLWSNENCQGYEIQYSSDNGKTWIKHPQINNRNNIKTTISSLKPNTKYVFRIRCQKTNKDRGTTWSQYSPWSSITVK